MLYTLQRGISRLLHKSYAYATFLLIHSFRGDFTNFRTIVRKLRAWFNFLYQHLLSLQWLKILFPV